MTLISSDAYLFLGGALGPLLRRWLARRPIRSRDTVGEMLTGAACTVLAVAFGLSLATSAGATDRGSVWNAGGITPQEDGANFAVLPQSDSLTLIYTRVSASPTQLRVYRSPDGGATVTLAQDAIATGRATAYNPNAAMLLASGQTLLGGFTPGAVSATPEAPWLRGTGAVWSTPTVTGLPSIGPTAAPFPSPFTSGFLRAVSLVSAGGTILSPVDNNSANPPVVCRSTDQAVSFACVALPASIGTVRWRDPASGSTSTPGSAQPLVSPTPTRWLLMDSNAQIFRSTDDGLTWTLVTRLTTDASISWAIACLPAQQRCVALTSSYAAGMNRIFVTGNGGDTWSTAYTVPRGDLLTTLSVAGGNTVLALGDPSAQLPALFGLQSQDGGTTWFPIVSPHGGWGGPGVPVLLATSVNNWFTGNEEIDVSNKTTWSLATIATSTTINPRSVGPGHSFLSNTQGQLGLQRNSSLPVCTAGNICTWTTRFYFRINTFVCQGTFPAGQDFGLSSWQEPGASGIGSIQIHFVSAAGVCTSKVLRLINLAVTVDGTTQLATGQWYRVEWTTSTNGNARTMSMRLFLEDQTTILSSLSASSASAVSSQPAFLLFGNSVVAGALNSATMQLDDVGYRYQAGTSASQLSGPAAIWTVAPTSDVAVQWSPASNNFTFVDDVPGTPDDGATQVTSGTTNLVDRLGIAPLTSVPLNWAPARAFVNFRSSDSGVGALAAAQFWSHLGANLTGPTSTGGGGFKTASLTSYHLVVDPNGASVADANAWNIGYKGKIGGTTALMTSVWLNVEMALLGNSGGGGDSAVGVGLVPFWQDQQPYARADGSILIWTFWSNVLGTTNTPSYIQAFNAAPVISAAPGVPLPKDPAGLLVFQPRGALVDTPRADVAVTTVATVVLGNNLNRVRGTCVNLGPDGVRVGDATITATRGVRVAAGRAFTTPTSSAVYAITELTTATVVCSEDLP